jgi:polar amino acid transport system substrate-binding protein
MNPIRRIKTPVIGALASAALLAGALSACSSSGSSSASNTATTSGTSGASAAKTPTKLDAAARALLPSSVTSSNTITVASSIGFAPFELYAADGTTPEGLDVDLMHAIEPILGVRFKISDVRYPNIMPSLQAGRYMVGWSAFGEYSDAAKAVDFVTYLSDSSGAVLVPSGDSVAAATDLCGRSTGMVNGEPMDLITALDAKCTAAKKPAIQVKMFQKTADIVLAMESGQLYSRLSDDANGGYIVKQTGGKLKLVTGVLPAVKSYVGVVVPKGQTGLEKALAAALQDTVTDGQYASILGEWGAKSGALTKITLGMPAS